MLLSTLRNDVRFECVGIADPIIDRNILLSAKEFFRRTHTWRIIDDPLTSPVTNSDGSKDYTLDLPTNADYGKVIGVRQENFEVEPIDQYRLQHGYVRLSSLVRIIFDGLNTLQTVFQSDDIDEGNTLTISYSLIPTAFTTDIDDAVMTRWSEVIQYGTKCRLFRMPEKTWSNPSESTLNFRLFEDGIAKANGFAARGNGGAPIRTRAYA